MKRRHVNGLDSGVQNVGGLHGVAAIRRCRRSVLRAEIEAIAPAQMPIGLRRGSRKDNITVLRLDHDELETVAEVELYLKYRQRKRIIGESEVVLDETTGIDRESRSDPERLWCLCARRREADKQRR